MSLEQNVQALTAAIVALTETIVGKRAGAAAIPTAVTKTDTVADLPKTPAAPAATKPADSGPITGPTLEYKDVAGPVSAFVKAHGTVAAVAILSPFGVRKLTEAKPEQWAAILAAFNAVTQAQAGAV